MGRKKLLARAGWVEVSVAPHGKRAALPRECIQGVLDSSVEGIGAFITYVAGNATTNLPVLDLYLPLLHEVLQPEPGVTCYTPYIWNDPNPDPAVTLKITSDNGDDLTTPQNT